MRRNGVVHFLKIFGDTAISRKDTLMDKLPYNFPALNCLRMRGGSGTTYVQRTTVVEM